MTTDEAEAKARALGDDRGRLLAHLRGVRKLLTDYWRFGDFQTYRFDFENKRLVGTGPRRQNPGDVWLQWRVRKDPDAPPSYENQQTSVGHTMIEFRPINPTPQSENQPPNP